MAIDVWFPLAIYYEDLPDSGNYNPQILDRINSLRAESGEQRTSANSSWTGDVHNVDRLHLDPAFEWLTRQVGHHAYEYLKTIGHDLSIMDVYVQRAWPVIAYRSQHVSAHAHHTAHLSAVYYVDAPKAGNAGQIRFLNEYKYNEVSTGIGSNMTGGYRESNAYNFGSAAYKPIAGRLLLFPSKQIHEVLANETDEARVSISFDMVLTGRGTADEGHHEFLMPPPGLWRRFDRSGADLQATLPPPIPADGRRALSEITRQYQPIDEFSLVDHKGHALWETTTYPDCSNRAAWRQYAALLDAIAPEEWLRDHTGTVEMWSGGREWHAYSGAVDRVYSHLRGQDVPLEGANLTPPTVQRRSTDQATTHERGKAHLCVYLRLDYDTATPCTVEFAEGGQVNLGPGEMAIISGFRRHRVVGQSHVMQFQIDLPALARANGLEERAMRGENVLDTVAFAALTARPLTRPIPGSDELFEKIRQLDKRERRRQRTHSSKVVQRLLVENADPASATEEELRQISNYGSVGADDHRPGVVGERHGILSPEQCSHLIEFACDHMTSTVMDSVDDLPEYQIDLTPDLLQQLLGPDAAADLMRLPEILDDNFPDDPAERFAHVDMFLRMYSPETRQFIAFHHDTCAYTANVALNEGSEFKGGTLLALQDGVLAPVPRKVGSAVVHAGDLVHGVTKITEGTRYSLILFFHQRADAPSVATAAE